MFVFELNYQIIQKLKLDVVYIVCYNMTIMIDIF
jgi:hypothetical protein